MRFNTSPPLSKYKSRTSRGLADEAWANGRGSYTASLKPSATMAPTRRRKPDDDVDLEAEVSISLILYLSAANRAFIFEDEERDMTWNESRNHATLIC